MGNTLSRRTLFKRSGQVLGSAAVLGSMTSFLESCGTSSTTPGGPATLRFSMLQDPGEIRNAQTLGIAFSQNYPKLTMKYEPITGAYDQKIITETAGGTAPDVFWVADVYTPPFASKKTMLALDPYLTKDGVNVSDIYPGMLGLGKYNNQTYVLPRDYNHVVTFYNKDAFKKAGLATPSLDWTYDDFLQACEALVTKGGVKYAINLSTWWAIYVPFVRGFGGDMLSSDGKSATFGNTAGLAGFQAFTDLVAKGYAVNPANPPAGDPFVSGQAAMTWSVRPIVSSLISGIGSSFTWDVTRFPKMPQNPVIGGGMSGYAVSSQTQNKDLAAKFVEFIISPTGQKIFEATGNSVPVLKSLQNDSIWLNLPRPDFNNQAFFYDNQHDTLPPSVPPSAQSAYDTAIGDALTSVFLHKSSVGDAVKKAADAVNSALASA